MATFMRENDAPSSKYAECFVKRENGDRKSLLIAKDFEANASVETKEVPVLGKLIKGRKPMGLEIKIKMTIYKCTEYFDNLIEEYKETGILPTFEISVTNNDPTTSIGNSIKIYRDVVLDGDVLLSMFDAEGEFIEQSIEGYACDYSSNTKYKDPEYLM